MAGKKAKGRKAATAKKRTAKPAKPARKATAKKAVKRTAKTANKAKSATRKAAKKVVSAVKKATRTARKAAVKVARKAKPRARPKKVAPAKKKDGRPPNWPALSPYLAVRDAAASIAFYESAFGFSLEGEAMLDGDGRIMHAGMRLGDACIMFAPQGMSDDMRTPVDSGGIGLSLYVYVADVDALAARAQRAGVALQQAPKTEFWGDRITIIRDPDGYHWTFATNVGEFDASKAPF